MDNFFYSDHPLYPRLEQNLDVDVCVVGGGIAGLMCAYELVHRGKSVCVLEADRIASGETGRSSAIVTFAHDLIYYRLIKKHGEGVARAYLEQNRQGAAALVDLIKRHSIDCDLVQRDFVLFATTKQGAKDIAKERAAYKRLNQPFDAAPSLELPYSVVDAFALQAQHTLDPVKLCRGLCKVLDERGCKIFEKTHAVNPPQENTLAVGSYKVRADSFVIATHYPYHNLRGLYFAKLYQHRSHLLAADYAPPFEKVYESAEQDGFEYREANGKLLIGGANVRTGKYNHQSAYHLLEQHAKNAFLIEPQRICARFSAQDIITLDLLPMAGVACKLTENVFIVSGFNKWGFSTSGACSKIVADLIDKKPIDNPFCPQRMYFLRAPIKTLKNLGNILGGFLSAAFSPDAKKLKRIGRGMGAVVVYRHRRLGVYRDEQDALHVVDAVCPHMGCSLKFNKDDKSWDCPCHGSRFDINGRVLNNPSLHHTERVCGLWDRQP